ncbi:MAG: heme exporter protein CcmB [Ignavibacteria bacterium]|nr:heme exporter protein CcmB [Ignavibacteria bacterium]MBK7256108.1 heme exporter protein CcmB [Ignavibacteria bacterium]MBK7444669.1 heme exporter protein CcmB [Ignavibacteria bacterium]MBK8382180.1 heme exporter protein CcmB [Ignavibacteria bacterium]MBK9403656.1 heme exporter protein CcmB [Ignavibacteria bacterium]
MLIFKKDLKSELRTRYVINSLLMFVLVTISVIRFALGDEKTENELLTGLLWISIFFSTSNGLSRTFVKEEERETSIALKLSSDSTAVLTGKLLFNLVLSFALNILILILFILITDYSVKNVSGFLITVIIGNFGLVSASTIIAAIISKANSKGTLYPVLSFPVLLPLLITVINATKLASLGVGTEKLYGEIIILVSYTIVITVVSYMLFRFVWED